jgi:hypothetical protein
MFGQSITTMAYAMPPEASNGDVLPPPVPNATSNDMKLRLQQSTIPHAFYKLDVN